MVNAKDMIACYSCKEFNRFDNYTQAVIGNKYLRSAYERLFNCVREDGTYNNMICPKCAADKDCLVMPMWRELELEEKSHTAKQQLEDLRW